MTFLGWWKRDPFKGWKGDLQRLGDNIRSLQAAPSKAPVVEKDQQDPHLPWFFTSVTAPFLGDAGDDFFAVVLKQQANLGNLAGFLNKKTLRAWWNLKNLTLISLMSRDENSLFRFQAACWYRHRYYYHSTTTKLSLFWIWITARWKKTTTTTTWRIIPGIVSS